MRAHPLKPHLKFTNEAKTQIQTIYGIECDHERDIGTKKKK